MKISTITKKLTSRNDRNGELILKDTCSYYENRELFLGKIKVKNYKYCSGRMAGEEIILLLINEKYLFLLDTSQNGVILVIKKIVANDLEKIYLIYSGGPNEFAYIKKLYKNYSSINILFLDDEKIITSEKHFLYEQDVNKLKFEDFGQAIKINNQRFELCEFYNGRIFEILKYLLGKDIAQEILKYL